MDAQVAVVAAGAAVAGFVQGVSGFAFALVATAVWAQVLVPQVAAPLVVMCSLFGQALSIRYVLPNLDLRRAAPLLLGGVAGVPLGIALLDRVDPAGFKAAVGAILAVYCPAMLLARRLPLVTGGGRWADGAAGLVGGVMGGLGGLNGPAPTLWCALRGWDRDAARAVFQTYVLVVQAWTLAGYLVAGSVDAASLRLFAWAVPAMVVPNLLGVRLYARVSDVQFRRIVLLLLFLTGLGLLWNGVPALLARRTGSV